MVIALFTDDGSYIADKCEVATTNMQNCLNKEDAWCTITTINSHSIAN